MTLLESGEGVIARGWVGRARRLLDDMDEQTVGRVLGRPRNVSAHLCPGSSSKPSIGPEVVAEFARRFDDADLRALALNARGRMLIYSGRVREGLALLDEAMVGITLGEVSPLFAGETYCSLIEACQEVCDYGRAAEWTSALTRWVDSQPEAGALHRSVRSAPRTDYACHGAFTDGRNEFDLALERYVAAGQPAAAALAYQERADIRRIQGDLDGAESDLEHALELGHEPQPALALLWLARDRTSAAAASVRRLLAEPRDPVHRVGLLSVGVDVLLAVGDVHQATATAEDLSTTAEQFGCRPLKAMAARARGAVALAADDPLVRSPNYARRCSNGETWTLRTRRPVVVS